jgi:hypothetical protein
MAESAYEKARRLSMQGGNHHERMHEVLTNLANTHQVGISDENADAINEHLNSAFANNHISKQLHDAGQHDDAAIFLDRAADKADFVHRVLASSGSNVQGHSFITPTDIAQNYSLRHRGIRRFF